MAPEIVNMLPPSNKGEDEEIQAPSSVASRMTYFRVADGNNENAEQDDTLPLLEDDMESTLLPQTPESFRRQVSLQQSWSYIRRLGNFLYATTILIMLVVVPWISYSALKRRQVDQAAYKSAEVMVFGTLVLSFRLVYLHLTHWYMPQVQKYVVRILWMVPLYSVQSYMSLRFHDIRIYIDAVRDLYEAFVIASFVYYLIELLGGQDSMVRILQAKRSTHQHLGKHTFPLNLLLEPWSLGLEFTLQCKHGVLQYVVIKTIATILTYLFELSGVYGEGQFKWDVTYPYLAFMLNCSVMYALYCLMMLFHAVNEELRYPINWQPLGKFLCIKGVVFFTWWQGVIIFYFKSKGYIYDSGSWSGDDIANALIDYCVCFEMVLFALAHSYTFTYKEYLPSHLPPELRNNLGTLDTQLLDPPPPVASIDTTSDDSNHNGSNDSTTASRKVNDYYRPPAVLNRPMKFSDALWSSSIPKETMSDIRRLRNGIDNVMSDFETAGSISLPEINPNYQQLTVEEGNIEDASSSQHNTSTDERNQEGKTPSL